MREVTLVQRAIGPPMPTLWAQLVTVVDFNGRAQSRLLRMILDVGESVPDPDRDLAEGRYVRHRSSEDFLASLRARRSDCEPYVYGD